MKYSSQKLCQIVVKAISKDSNATIEDIITFLFCSHDFNV